jgi:hypothetical protein
MYFNKEKLLKEFEINRKLKAKKTNVLKKNMYILKLILVNSFYKHLSNKHKFKRNLNKTIKKQIQLIKFSTLKIIVNISVKL